MIDTKAFHDLSYGLYIIQALDENGRKVGCIANTFIQVSSKPAGACVSLNKDNITTAAIQQTDKFSVSVLSQKSTMELIGQFGFKSSYDIDKYEGISFDIWEDGLPYVTESCVASFEVYVNNAVDVESHLLFLGEVKNSKVLSDDEPLTYAYYHSTLKGKTPPKAVSYIEETSSSPENTERNLRKYAKEENASVKAQSDGNVRYGWQCTICGYIYEHDEMPDDFTCPICGVGKEFFERIKL